MCGDWLLTMHGSFFSFTTVGEVMMYMYHWTKCYVNVPMHRHQLFFSLYLIKHKKIFLTITRRVYNSQFSGECWWKAEEVVKQSGHRAGAVKVGAHYTTFARSRSLVSTSHLLSPLLLHAISHAPFRFLFLVAPTSQRVATTIDLLNLSFLLWWRLPCCC